MGVISKKCEVWKIYHSGYGPFLATDWLKTKKSGWVMGQYGLRNIIVQKGNMPIHNFYPIVR